MKAASIRYSGSRSFVGIGLAIAALAVGLPSPRPLLAQTGAKITGAAISKLPRDTRKLTVTAQAPAGSAQATGTVQFIHNGPNGLSRFRGTVACLSIAAGVVQISGISEKGETATGTLLDGKTYAFTIDTNASPQTFSLPTFGDPGMVGPCSGGSSTVVPITEDGFKIH